MSITVSNKKIGIFFLKVMGLLLGTACYFSFALYMCVKFPTM